jgi:hypothetical protein
LSVIFVIVKRKGTQALLGSNLLAILFTDILYRRRFPGLPFYLYRNPNMAEENPMFEFKPIPVKIS